ncbi:UbiH/UbiF/VisC/COQ6 family ubiquinone biosynthesis hydroxylase [Herminiimonas fonticola]|uniref:2-octaprenyl-6-methoxyphenol hydroxylase n=1 Tax=Herminiimonas fonticola TaxID=303380 RepID=A0A4R6G3P4_9BURK|nr:UbiH/UbiF/VisC/COQ6 family ubiquinone biosynthesis hydroxylase [Herminiimonas fonticola]RBA23253.1 Ubi-OHases: ubiquinone biosynthesis hydroxylase, UbiH/UbiF/VisC/COQ6 family [Herminiimonas fonticola]TDN88972.1 2-octaprenyl-6-methoxyphenol hydroxylase [Herminiimonas fonticola]
MQTDFDIAICGAGPVGLTLAALLVKQGVKPERIALIDAKTIEQTSRDPRAIALSYGSRQIFEAINSWPIAATQINQIHVSRRGHFGRTMIEREEYDLPALGYVTRYGAIVAALNAHASNMGISLIRPASVNDLIENDTAVTLAFADRAAITAKIVVQAEGGIFTEQVKKSMHRDYGQTAIVAHVTTSAPIPHRAYERFTDEGPLALLPQEDGYALVWCVKADTAQRLLALNDAGFLEELGTAFGTRLGRFTATTQRNTFPLGLNAQAASSSRTVAIGNAAQTLHPVAGQGLNLGLRDASVLARLLAKRMEPAALQEFSATRVSDRNVTIHLTDIMARIFASAPAGGISQALLGLSLGLVDGIKPAKKLLAEQMMFGRRS